MADAVVDEKGRITIPLELRTKLGLSFGSKIIFSVINNTLLIRKTIDASEYESIADGISEKLEKDLDSPVQFEKLF